MAPCALCEGRSLGYLGRRGQVGTASLPCLLLCRSPWVLYYVALLPSDRLGMGLRLLAYATKKALTQRGEDSAVRPRGQCFRFVS